MPDALPDGRVGQPYFFQLSVPAGMKLPEDGALDGMPLQAGSYAFTVTGHYWYKGGEDGMRASVTRRYELTILPR